MDFDVADSNRKTRLTRIRLFADQFESLNRLRVSKHRGRCTIADLVREALDEYIDRENQELAGRR
jgi:predicted DNA-binding protein